MILWFHMCFGGMPMSRWYLTTHNFSSCASSSRTSQSSMNFVFFIVLLLSILKMLCVHSTGIGRKICYHRGKQQSQEDTMKTDFKNVENSDTGIDNTLLDGTSFDNALAKNIFNSRHLGWRPLSQRCHWHQNILHWYWYANYMFIAGVVWMYIVKMVFFNIWISNRSQLPLFGGYLLLVEQPHMI